MNEKTNILKRFSIKYTISIIKKEIVLIIATILAIVTSIISTPKLEYINFKVLILLFNLMIIVSSFKELNVLDSIATAVLTKCKSNRAINFVLVFITFISSMLITNDVALITFVPITLIIGKKAKINTLNLVIYQTLAANLGSALTPMGNPQNLYIYSLFNISPVQFFKITSNFVVLSILFLTIIMIKSNKDTLSFQLSNVNIENKRCVLWFCLVFIVILLSVFYIVDYRFAFIVTLLVVTLLNKELFTKVDYSLLLTFIAFFVFIGNISSMYIIKNFMCNILNSGKSTYYSSILVSQLISNVPAAMLISKFTNYYKELLLGVNIGGMGTIIASMASLISYKFYLKEYPYQGGKYIKLFTLYNIIGLAVFIPLIYFLMK